MTTTATTSDVVSTHGNAEQQAAEALAGLRDVRDLQEASRPLRRLLEEIDELVRARSIDCANANVSQRTIATVAGVTQPTVNGWLDGRANAPLPALSTAKRAWMLHQVSQSVASLLQRMEGEVFPSRAPSGDHSEPRVALREAKKNVSTGAQYLGRFVAALEYAARTQLR